MDFGEGGYTLIRKEEIVKGPRATPSLGKKKKTKKKKGKQSTLPVLSRSLSLLRECVNYFQTTRTIESLSLSALSGLVWSGLPLPRLPHSLTHFLPTAHSYATTLRWEFTHQTTPISVKFVVNQPTAT